MRVWVRATDIMGNQKTDFTVVNVDTTGPAVTSENDTQTSLTLNYNGQDAKYNYTSRYVQLLPNIMTNIGHYIGHTIAKICRY